MNNDLKSIKARLDKASPGPWRTLAGARRVSIRDVWPAPSVAVANPLVLGNDEHVIGEISPYIEDGDRDFIVHARMDVANLYDELRLARAHLRDVLNGELGAAVAAAAYLNDAERST